MFNFFKKRKYQYKYDITPVQFPNHNSNDGVTTQMKYDIYGLYGSEKHYISDKLFFEGAKAMDEMSLQEMLNVDLSMMHPGLCWRLYHKVRERKGEV